MKFKCLANIHLWRRYFLCLCALLTVAQVLVLLEFFPRLMSRSDKFPIMGTCQIISHTVIDNFCLTETAIAQASIDRYWRSCLIIKINTSFSTPEKFIINMNESNTGYCQYFIANIFEQSLEVSQYIAQNAYLNNAQPQFCWINVLANTCIIIDMERVRRQFFWLAGSLLMAWLLSLFLSIYAQRVYKIRRNKTLPVN